MSGFYRLGFHWNDQALNDPIEATRWSLVALDPEQSQLLCGGFTASDGANVPYRLWPAIHTCRAAILFLHGAGDYSGAYNNIGPRFARLGFAGMAIDQRGFGGTASRGHWSSQERMVSDVAEAIDFLKHRIPENVSIFLLGESMGGAIAVHTAADPSFGANVAGLILVAPGALTKRLWHLGLVWVARTLRAIMPKGRIVCERLQTAELGADDAIRLLADPMVLRAVSPEMLLGVVTLAHHAVAAARSVSVPVLTMLGTNDDLLSKSCVSQLHENLGGPKTWLSFKKGPHLLLHWQRANKVLKKIIRWLTMQTNVPLDQSAPQTQQCGTSPVLPSY